nr:hypothetical protein [Rhodothermus marinus]
METTAVTVTEESFGQLPDGRPVTLFRLRNASGMEVEVLNYGAIIRAIRVPDREGNRGDVVLGFDSLAAYLHPIPTSARWSVAMPTVSAAPASCSTASPTSWRPTTAPTTCTAG